MYKSLCVVPCSCQYRPRFRQLLADLVASGRVGPWVDTINLLLPWMHAADHDLACQLKNSGKYQVHTSRHSHVHFEPQPDTFAVATLAHATVLLRSLLSCCYSALQLPHLTNPMPGKHSCPCIALHCPAHCSPSTPQTCDTCICLPCCPCCRFPLGVLLASRVSPCGQCSMIP